ncbi:MAG: endonuclease III domain-containing protein [Verrucomicrobia bacterium]|nr:endonuclease III domain-containing protein [Verrucomicrobiota bacterium]
MYPTFMTSPLKEVYDLLYRAWGPQHWWPGRTRFEVIVGAILTQNTAWTNVEKAIRVMKANRALVPIAIYKAGDKDVASWIRPAGYFNVKARRLKAFVEMLYTDFNGDLNHLFRLETEALRDKLLSVNGIGPETADSILLYAAKRPVFVVDAYTMRFMSRHGWLSLKASYDDAVRLMTASLPKDVDVYNEYHALIVNLGKEYCRPTPRCEECPLKPFLPSGRPILC